MFLFSVEGGDGSGKGLATQVISEILEEEFCFTSVEKTAEPRRNHPLGRLAIDSVRKKTMSPEQEAGLFAADRLDHSHGWILPKLLEGKAIVSERNIHSSLVYQGIVGGIGIGRTAQINSAALIPDLCIWVDCDPKIALERIRSETLRGLSDKEEYFETSDFQIRIRQGYHDLLSGRMEMPTPFDMGAIIGPISNEGSQKDLRRILKDVIRSFMISRNPPINVQMEKVDQFHIKSIVKRFSSQSTLSDLGVSPSKNNSHWLRGDAPWKVLKSAQNNHKQMLSSFEEEKSDRINEIPKNILNHSVSSICGTLSLLQSAEISELRSNLGPVRYVSERHTRRIIKFLRDFGWISQRKNLLGRDSPKSQLKSEYYPFGRLMLAIWPLRKEITHWQRRNPKTHLRFCIGQLEKSGLYDSKLRESIERLSIIGSGSEGHSNPTDTRQLSEWWKGP
ncbi:MAG: dTMP kinase [Euryarchaeota archaeon]|nr:dTMP kinase [Euryarchaeota archaeon]|tara:strand:+ start:520 stop:1866 length:1347 start_codon:yes stop_codon:yes gene_type:complete